MFWCTRTSTNSHSQPQLIALACRFLLPSKLEVSPGFTRHKSPLPCAPQCSLDCYTPLFTQLSKNRRPQVKWNKLQSGLLTLAHGALVPVTQTVQRRFLKKYQRSNYVSPTILEITGRVQNNLSQSRLTKSRPSNYLVLFDSSVIQDIKEYNADPQ